MRPRPAPTFRGTSDQPAPPAGSQPHLDQEGLAGGIARSAMPALPFRESRAVSAPGFLGGGEGRWDARKSASGLMLQLWFHSLPAAALAER